MNAPPPPGTDPQPRRIRIDLAYDGTEFAGWQYQPNRRTVQGTLEQALVQLQGGRELRVRAASRTDAGTHARQQVADCLIATRLSDDAALLRALRHLLPPDVRPLALRSVPDDFDAQRLALRKTYCYRVDRSPHGDPFLARYALHHPHRFDAELVREALGRLRGRRDWSGFADSRCRIEHRVRELQQADYVERGDAGWFVFTADGFLTYMVRNIVGTLLEIGGGRMNLQRIGEILDSGDRRLAAATAAAHGLCLWRIVYADDASTVEERSHPWAESW